MKADSEPEKPKAAATPEAAKPVEQAVKKEEPKPVEAPKQKVEAAPISSPIGKDLISELNGEIEMFASQIEARKQLIEEIKEQKQVAGFAKAE